METHVSWRRRQQAAYLLRLAENRRIQLTPNEELLTELIKQIGERKGTIDTAQIQQFRRLMARVAPAHAARLITRGTDEDPNARTPTPPSVEFLLLVAVALAILYLAVNVPGPSP